MTRETVGKISSDLSQKTPDSRDPIELEREMQKGYMEELHKAIIAYQSTVKEDCFVVVITKQESLMKNVFRNYFFARKTCPSPDYDQTVFKYHAKEAAIQYFWTIPSRGTSWHLKENALLVSPEERPLLDFVLKFFDGSLYRLCKRLNGEEAHSNILVN